MLRERYNTRALVAAALLGAAGVASASAAEVNGVVRDAHGMPQMGVLVEILGARGMATALTDLHGQFELKDVRPGEYDLRMSGAFLSPMLRRGLRVRAGTMPALNVVLTGWFEDVGSLAPHSRAVGDAVTDWKWTLRSPAARPMLRVADDDPADKAQDEGGRKPEGDGQHGMLRTAAGMAGFGESRESASVLVGASARDGRTEDVLEVMAGAAGWNSAGVPTGARAVYESGRGEGLQRKVTITARALPQIMAGAEVDGLVLLQVDSLERMEVGSFAALEVGGRTEAVRAGGTAFAVEPMMRLSLHPWKDWAVSYALESTPGQSSAGSVTGQESVPMVERTAYGMRLVTRAEQSVRVAHHAGATRAEVAVLRERADPGVLGGMFAGGSGGTAGLAMVDAVTGTFRRGAPIYGGWGGAVAVESTVGDATTVAARFMMAPALRLGGEPAAALDVRSAESPAVILEMRRSVTRGGTEAGVSYRWQPAEMVTTVGAFEASRVQPYLGLHVRQRLPIRCGEGRDAELLVDAANVLGEGYHRVGTGGAQELLLMSALREVRAGVEVSF